MKYHGIREQFPAREKSRKPRKLSEEKKKEIQKNLKSLRKRVMMNWTPAKCRERIEMLKRSYMIRDRKEQIAEIEEHLRSIGKD